MQKFWNHATAFKHSLQLSSEQQNDYKDLHDWFRFKLWSDTRVSLLNCIDDLREKVAENPLMNVAPRAGLFGVDSSGAHPASSQRSRKRQRCENDQDFSDLERAAWDHCWCTSDAFWDIQTIRTGMTVRRAEHLYRATTEGPRYSRVQWTEWFAANPFDDDDMTWVVGEMKQDFAFHDLRKKKVIKKIQRCGDPGKRTCIRHSGIIGWP